MTRDVITHVEGAIATRPCAGCGEPLESLARFCNRCGRAAENAPTEREPAPTETLSCEGCGAAVSFPAGQISTRCPFCDSTAVQRIAPEGQAPEFVIGFAVDRDKATTAFASWLKQDSWFRPGDLRTAARLDDFQGIYLPCWSFSALARSHYHAAIGEYWYRTETYTTTNSKGQVQTHTRQVRETEWYDFEGSYDAWQRGYITSASRGLPQNELELIKPFDTSAMRRYEPAYLAGWPAEAPSVGTAQALQIAEEHFRAQQAAAIGAYLPGDTHRGLDVETAISEVADDLVYLPVWIAAYRYHDKVYRFLINGQTGKLHGKKPVSALRITAAVILGLAIVAGIVLLFRG